MYNGKKTWGVVLHSLLENLSNKKRRGILEIVVVFISKALLLCGSFL